MCNGRNDSVCYAITTYVVHTYKNEYQKNVIKDTFGCHFLFCICLIVARSTCQKQSFADVLQNRCSLNLGKSLGKTLVWSLFLIKACSFIKNDSNTGVFFPMSFPKSLRTSFFPYVMMRT